MNQNLESGLAGQRDGQQNHKKYNQGPQRAQISLKSRRKKIIPEIKIELDEMLGQAFSEIKMQPKKNMRLGTNDIFVLDNDLLRHYIEAVYQQYGIQDPLSNHIVYPKANNEIPNPKLRSSSNMGRVYQTPSKPQTPKRAPKQKQQEDKSIKVDNSKIHTPSSSGRINKTAERITKLKQNFQTQLKSHPTAVFENQNKTEKKKFEDGSHNSSQVSQSRNSYNQQVKPHAVNMNIGTSNIKKKQQVKILRRSSQNLTEPATKSYLLKKTKHKYCLMCEQPLQSDLINSHEKNCPDLQNLLNTPNLKIQQISVILCQKITKLEAQLCYYQSNMHEDTLMITQLLQRINQQPIDDESEGQGDGGGELNRAFSMLSTVKCMEGLDKLNWFKKMKAKAEGKKA